MLRPPLPQPGLEPVRPVRDSVSRDGVQDLLVDPQAECQVVLAPGEYRLLMTRPALDGGSGSSRMNPTT